MRTASSQTVNNRKLGRPIMSRGRGGRRGESGEQSCKSLEVKASLKVCRNRKTVGTSMTSETHTLSTSCRHLLPRDPARRHGRQAVNRRKSGGKLCNGRGVSRTDGPHTCNTHTAHTHRATHFLSNNQQRNTYLAFVVSVINFVHVHRHSAKCMACLGVVRVQECT